MLSLLSLTLWPPEPTPSSLCFNVLQKLLPVVAAKTRDWTRIITHRLPLSEGVRGYEMFDKKLDGCVKVVLKCD